MPDSARITQLRHNRSLNLKSKTNICTVAIVTKTTITLPNSSVVTTLLVHQPLEVVNQQLLSHL